MIKRSAGGFGSDRLVPHSKSEILFEQWIAIMKTSIVHQLVMIISGMAALSMDASSAICADAPEMRYSAPKSKVFYQVKITVDTPTEVATYAGQTSYQARQSKSKNVSLKFQGGLKKSAKAKGRSTGFGRRRGPGGPRRPGGGGPPRPGFPFGSSQGTTALQQTTSNIELTTTGDILSLTGQSQIPVPLGHLSLLVFDALPDEAKDSWSTENGVVLGQKDDSSQRFPRRPFDPNTKAKRTSSGSESATYTVKSNDGSRVTIDKKYKLDSPNSETPFTFAGGGTVVFDSEVGMFASADLKYELKLSSKNVDVRIPVTIEYQMLTEEEVAEQARKKKELADAAMAKGMATARAAFKDSTQEQIAAIYKKGGLVPPTGRIITPEMEIPVGLIAQNKWPTQYKWSATRIAQILPNNMIKIQSLESKRYYVRNRNTLSLAPDFVDQSGLDNAALEKFRQHVATLAND